MIIGPIIDNSENIVLKVILILCVTHILEIYPVVPESITVNTQKNMLDQ